jgi:hypothetical protein
MSESPLSSHGRLAMGDAFTFKAVHHACSDARALGWCCLYVKEPLTIQLAHYNMVCQIFRHIPTTRKFHNSYNMLRFFAFLLVGSDAAYSLYSIRRPLSPFHTNPTIPVFCPLCVWVLQVSHASSQSVTVLTPTLALTRRSAQTSGTTYFLLHCTAARNVY